jgi:putative ATP-grasp target RiPP
VQALFAPFVVLDVGQHIPRSEKETVVTSQHAAYAAVFPISDQLPLGRAMTIHSLRVGAVRSGDVLGSDGVKTGHDTDERTTGATGPDEILGAPRPFGLRFATLPQRAVELPLDAIVYDDDTQVALAKEGSGWAPLADHSMGLTLRTTGQIPREDEIHDKSS